MKNNIGYCTKKNNNNNNNTIGYGGGIQLKKKVEVRQKKNLMSRF
jgi:hypothetical protein